MLADYHVHTAFSNDSVYPMEDVVKDAISLGMEDICFTDHVDYGPYRDWDDPRGIEYRAGEEGEPEWVALTNVKSVYLIATRDLSNLWLQFFLSQNQGFMRLFEKTVLK